MQKGKSNRQAAKSASQVKRARFASTSKKITSVSRGDAAGVRGDSHFAVKTNARQARDTADVVTVEKRTVSDTIAAPRKRKLSLSDVADKLQDRELFVEKVRSARAIFNNSKPLPI